MRHEPPTLCFDSSHTLSNFAGTALAGWGTSGACVMNIPDLGRRPDEAESAWKARITAEVWDEIPQLSPQKRAATPPALPARATPAPTRNSPPRPQETAPKGERRYLLLSADEMAAMGRGVWRVKGCLPKAGLVGIGADWAAGKTFFIYYLAEALSDRDEFFGHRISENCDVLIVVLEGVGGCPQRIGAIKMHRGPNAGRRMKFVTTPFSLLYDDDVDALIATIQEEGMQGGAVMLDTYNAATAGMDENGSADTGRAIAAAKRIQEAVGGLVILVHHFGKDPSKGLRGHSSLSAALDTIIEISRVGGRRSWRLAKSKDGADGVEHSFRLQVVEVGTDEDGDPITSCVVVPEENACDIVRRAQVPRGGNQRAVYDVAGELLREGRNMGQGGAPATRPCIRLADLIAACRGRLAVENDRVPERVRLAVTGLVNSGCVILRDDWIWLP